MNRNKQEIENLEKQGILNWNVDSSEERYI